ncbi:hypothetical protein TIFTF001_030678 [Ficus carica]|uniref:Ubiquitin fusion degradaton protein n=1 Tax=Ficus carica TaxID=3494 RepID=A0AA88DTJ7_FICCA|nr:hypothetical protein TIFTF001_030678 [Ficus carica]
MRPFEKSYPCYPISMTGKSHLENGDKIIMPSSALTSLSTKNVQYPMLFQLKNKSKRKVSHCGVLEFSAEEGKVFLPSWIMLNMKLRDGDEVIIRNVTLKKATSVKLRPHETAFVELSNPKAVLEKLLRGFSCLATGETIVIDYNEKKYSIDVLETKPKQKAVSIIDADIEVSFALAKDYQKAEKPAATEATTAEKVEEDDGLEKDESSFQAFTGKSYKLSD